MLGHVIINYIWIVVITSNARAALNELFNDKLHHQPASKPASQQLPSMPMKQWMNRTYGADTTYIPKLARLSLEWFLWMFFASICAVSVCLCLFVCMLARRLCVHMDLCSLGSMCVCEFVWICIYSAVCVRACNRAQLPENIGECQRIVVFLLRAFIWLLFQPPNPYTLW